MFQAWVPQLNNHLHNISQQPIITAPHNTIYYATMENQGETSIVKQIYFLILTPHSPSWDHDT